MLVNAPRATVFWDEIKFRPVEAPKPRRIKVAAVNLYPRKSQDPVGEFMKLVDTRINGADLIVLPEGITVVGTGKTYLDVAEPVPGPTTQRLGERILDRSRDL